MAVIISMAVVINDDYHRFYYNKLFVMTTIQQMNNTLATRAAGIMQSAIEGIATEGV
jgi:hypothetical protein